MFRSTILCRAYMPRPHPSNFTPTERFLRGSVRLWARQVGDRRMKANIPLLGFLEFIARRSQERRTRAVDLGATGDGEEEPMMLNAYRMLQGARTIDINEVTESVHLRPFFDNYGFYHKMMKIASEWKISEKVSVTTLMEEHFPDMTPEQFINLQSLVDEFLGMKDDYLFAVNRNLEEDYTFLLRRVLWSSDEDGVLLSDLEPKMRRLWNLEHQNVRSGSNSHANRELSSSTANDNNSSVIDSTGNIPLPSLPFRCKGPADVLRDSNLSEWHFTIEEKDPQNSNKVIGTRVFHFGWEAALRDVIRSMPPTGLPNYMFRRAVLSHHPCLAHSREHGSWKSIMDRLIRRHSDWVSVSVSRTDQATHIVRRLMPTDTHARDKSVTSETIHALQLMENFGSSSSSSIQQRQSNKQTAYSFDDIFRCMSDDVKAQVEGSESIYQSLKMSKFLEPDVRLFVRENAKRANTETIVLLDSSVIEGGVDNIPKILLQANPQEAPQARLVCARKKHEQSFFPSTSTSTSTSGNDINNSNKGEDVIAPDWMPNSVILIAQLAKIMAQRQEVVVVEQQQQSVPQRRRLKNIIVIVSESEDKEALRKEIQTLVGDNVGIEFASPKLI